MAHLIGHGGVRLLQEHGLHHCSSTMYHTYHSQDMEHQAMAHLIGHGGVRLLQELGQLIPLGGAVGVGHKLLDELG